LRKTFHHEGHAKDTKEKSENLCVLREAFVTFVVSVSFI